MGGIHAHIKKAPESSFTYTGEKSRKMNQEARSQDTESVGTLSLDLAVSRTVRNSILVLMVTQTMVIHYRSLNGLRQNLWRPSPCLSSGDHHPASSFGDHHSVLPLRPLLSPYLFLWRPPSSPCLFVWGPSPLPCLFYPIDLPHLLKWSWALGTGTE